MLSISEINSRGDIMTDTANIKEIIKEYWDNLYAHKFNILHEMDKFLKNKKLPNSLMKDEKTPKRST